MENYEQAYKDDRGSVVKGALGAFLGAALGAVAWAVVLMLGYVASVVGLLIAFLSSKGYDMLHGRQGIIKAVIVIICVLLAIVGATVGWDIADSIKEYNTQLAECSPLEAAQLKMVCPTAWDFAMYYLQDAENQDVIMENCGMGIVFGLIGSLGFVFANKDNRKQSAPDAQAAAPDTNPPADNVSDISNNS